MTTTPTGGHPQRVTECAHERVIRQHRPPRRGDGTGRRQSVAICTACSATVHDTGPIPVVRPDQVERQR